MMIKKPKSIKLGLAARIEAFLKIRRKTDRQNCWIWKGCKDAKGYGRVRFKGKMYWTHRLMYATANNGRIKHGLHVHHKCFNPSCVNPLHLEAMKSSINSGLKRV